MICEVCGYDPELEISDEWSMQIEAKWPSQNELSSNMRGYGGHKYRKWRRTFEELIPMAAPGADVFRRVWLTRHWGTRKRAYDYANLVGGAKPLVDTLVSFGWLVDDAPRWTTVIYQQEKSPDGKDRILIRVEEPCSSIESAS